MSTIESSDPPGQDCCAPRQEGTDRVRHILLLDDDESFLFLVKRMLERRGYRVSTYTNQQQALAALRNAPSSFHLVITDYNMPGMSGLAVAREVNLIRLNLPVVVASGAISEELRANAADAGIKELISKGLDVKELCAAIERLASTAANRA